MGRLNGQNPKANGIPFSLFYLLYIDDGAFLFNSREDLIKGTNMLYDHFKAFGLSMHIGENGNKSKSDVMYIAPNFAENLKSPEENTSPIPVKQRYVNVTTNSSTLALSFQITLNVHRSRQRIKKAASQVGVLKKL